MSKSIQQTRLKAPKAAEKDRFPNSIYVYYVLVAREDFGAGGKLFLRWRGPRRKAKAVSDYLFQFEDLRNGSVDEILACPLRFYSDLALDQTAIMPHILSYETGIPFARLMRINETKQGLMIQFRWKGLSHAEDIL